LVSFVVHQLALYSTLQNASYGIAVKHLDRYLLGAHNKGDMLFPLLPLELTCYVDADFCDTWDKKHLENDPDMAWSQRRFVVFVAGTLVFKK
jgi:hypothetical protein